MVVQSFKEWFAKLRRAGPEPRPEIVGVFGQPRGGTNFIAAALHYHPLAFSVSEHELDYRRPLSAYWKARSVFRIDGRQKKQIEQIKRVVFNKVQRSADLWNPHVEFAEGTRFVFYLRNPIRVHSSREDYRGKHDPGRIAWADTPRNYTAVLAEARRMLDTYEALRHRYPCLLLSHEYFCCEYETSVPQLYEFLDLPPIVPNDPRAFFKGCGRCGQPFSTIEHEGQKWLACPRHRIPVKGCGSFNPLRAIDRAGIADSAWKSTDDVGRMLNEMRRVLGDAIADYYWSEDYAQNLQLRSALQLRAA